MHRLRSLVLILAVVATLFPALSGWAAPKKVISLKNFIDCDEWGLDITYSAKDNFENQDYSGQLEVTATARYVLKRLDRQDAWGHWQALAVQSHNMKYRAFWQGKRSRVRIDYASKAGDMVAPLADFQVGGPTPGYMLVVNGGFPAEMRDSSAGLMNCPLLLGTTVKDQPGLSGVLTGPLPEGGTTISGSRTIPFEIAPFLKGMAGLTRMGISYVLKPIDLAPLVPKKKR